MQATFESTLLKLEILMKLEAEHGGIRALFISTICTAILRKYMAHDVVTWFSTSRDLQKRQMSTLTFFYRLKVNLFGEKRGKIQEFFMVALRVACFL